jgi:hypothetical protein
VAVRSKELVEVYGRPYKPSCYRVPEFHAHRFAEAVLASPFRAVWRSDSIDLSYRDPRPFTFLDEGNSKDLSSLFESRDSANYPEPEIAELLGRTYVEVFVVQSFTSSDHLRTELRNFDRGEPSCVKLVVLQISDDAHVFLYAPLEPEQSVRRVLEAAGVNFQAGLKHSRYWWLHSLQLHRYFALDEK